MMKFSWFLGFLLLAVLGGAEAQTTTVGAKVQFTVPTTRTDKSPITGALSYVVLAGAKGQTQKSRLTTLAKPGDVIQNVAPGTCFQLVTVEQQPGSGSPTGIEGPPSEESCLAAQPNAPTGFTVTVVITVTGP